MAITAAMRTTVTQLYAALFNRAPDSDGLGYWVQQLDSGTSTADVAKAMYDTTPARTYYPLWYSNEQIAGQFYTNLLGRTADTDGLAYWSGELATKPLGTVLTSFLDAVVGYTSDPTATGYDATLDALALSSQSLFNNKVTVGQYFAETLRSNDTTLAAAILTGVTTAASSVTAAEAAYATAASTAASTTFNLVAGADALTGTNGNDTFNAAIGTLTSSDEVHGGLGTDVLIAKIDNLTANNTGYTPVINGIETITLEARNASATFFMTNVSGVSTLNVKGITNFGLSDLANSGTVNVIEGYSADLTLNIGTNTASAQSFRVNLNNASGTDIIIADDSGTTAVDTLTLDAISSWGHSSATNFSGFEKLVLLGEGNISLNMASAVAGGLSADAFADTTKIDASGMTGALTLRLDSVDASIVGGAGADTFIMTASLNTNDTIDGGPGADTIDSIQSGGYVRPIISNVETLNIFVNSAAVTADLRDVSGVSTLNLLLATALLVDKSQTSMSTINVNSSDSTANALQVNFGTAAVASDVTLNLGNGVEGTLQTAAATASGMGIGTITMSGNSGSLTIVTNSTAKYSAAAVELNDFTAVTLNAASANLVVDGVVDVNTAQTLTLTVAAGKTMTIGDDLSADSVTNFTLNVGATGTFGLTGATASLNAASSTMTITVGASAAVDMSGSVLQLSGADTLNLSVGDGGSITAQTILLGQAGATAGSGALAMDNINISAAGDVNITNLIANTATVHSAISLSLNVTLIGSGTATDVGISGFAISDVAGGATASEQSVTINVGGTGQFKFSAAAIDTSNVTYHVTTTGLMSGSMVTIDLSGVNDTGSVASAVFGAHSGNYVGVDGVDNIELGLGAMTVDGGLGADVITFGNTAVNKVHMSVDTVAGQDTVLGAAAGDMILFGGANTATANNYLTAAWVTGTAYDTAQIADASLTAFVTTAAGLSGHTAVRQLAIYTAAGDTIIEVLDGSAGHTGISGANITTADFVRIVISNKDFAAITAAFQINSTGSGLSITLL
ncbi:MAG: DUF4214 domain-containing protein [Sterolibacterium sp.]